ncbi:hypothetical protein E2C01_030727 [Portunus trituberculatus]|uniref:Uncharacterized protein n=1 Tax=Portunus trituberculatus TaxID=210409 RepID=A0A5B7EWK4_PORTR|nr:hypothetical protein [Portunus trituberculatus]
MKATPRTDSVTSPTFMGQGAAAAPSSPPPQPHTCCRTATTYSLPEVPMLTRNKAMHHTVYRLFEILRH